MSNKNSSQNIQKFQKWRNQLYNALNCRRESVIELIDALSSNLQALSVVELSLNPLFQRNYNSLYKAIQEFLPERNSKKYESINKDLLKTVSKMFPQPSQRNFNLFGIDATPVPRPYSYTLKDRSYIYYPRSVEC